VQTVEDPEINRYFWGTAVKDNNDPQFAYASLEHLHGYKMFLDAFHIVREMFRFVQGSLAAVDELCVVSAEARKLLTVHPDGTVHFDSVMSGKLAIDSISADCEAVNPSAARRVAIAGLPFSAMKKEGKVADDKEVAASGGLPALIRKAGFEEKSGRQKGLLRPFIIGVMDAALSTHRISLRDLAHDTVNLVGPKDPKKPRAATAVLKLISRQDDGDWANCNCPVEKEKLQIFPPIEPTDEELATSYLRARGSESHAHDDISLRHDDISLTHASERFSQHYVSMLPYWPSDPELEKKTSQWQCETPNVEPDEIPNCTSQEVIIVS